jgi:hypothetical protein
MGFEELLARFSPHSQSDLIEDNSASARIIPDSKASQKVWPCNFIASAPTLTPRLLRPLVLRHSLEAAD